MIRKLWRYLVAIVLIALALFLWQRVPVQHWLAIHTGTVNESDGYYGFWSGFGSDLGEATLIVTVFGTAAAAYRHHNCHVKGCPWLGRPVHDQDGNPTPYICCPKHHPKHEGDKRGVSMETIQKAHEATKEVC